MLILRVKVVYSSFDTVHGRKNSSKPLAVAQDRFGKLCALITIVKYLKTESWHIIDVLHTEFSLVVPDEAYWLREPIPPEIYCSVCAIFPQGMENPINELHSVRPQQLFIPCLVGHIKTVRESPSQTSCMWKTQRNRV